MDKRENHKCKIWTEDHESFSYWSSAAKTTSREPGEHSSRRRNSYSRRESYEETGLATINTKRMMSSQKYQNEGKAQNTKFDDGPPRQDSIFRIDPNSKGLLNATDTGAISDMYENDLPLDRLNGEERDQNLAQFEDTGVWYKTLFRCQGRPFPVEPQLYLSIWCGAVVCINRLVPVPDLAVHTSPSVLSLISFLLGMLLVFRTQSSAARWWEARCVWEQLEGLSREVMSSYCASCHQDKDSCKFVGLLIIGFAHCVKNQVREVLTDSEENIRVKDYLFAGNVPDRYIDEVEKMFSDDSGEKGLRMLDLMRRNGATQVAEGRLPLPERSRINGMLCQMNACYGKCVRIHTTPLPIPYTIHLRTVLFVYFMVLPLFLLANEDYHPAMIGALCLVVQYLVLGVEELAVGIEDPFGTDAGDLPLEQYTNTIYDQVRNVIKFSRALSKDQTEKNT